MKHVYEKINDFTVFILIVLLLKNTEIHSDIMYVYPSQDMVRLGIVFSEAYYCSWRWFWAFLKVSSHFTKKKSSSQINRFLTLPHLKPIRKMLNGQACVQCSWCFHKTYVLTTKNLYLQKEPDILLASITAVLEILNQLQVFKKSLRRKNFTSPFTPQMFSEIQRHCPQPLTTPLPPVLLPSV